MITVKILCGCGQKYAFDVEPYQGRMPSTIQCPICKADGTQAANDIIARALPPQPITAIAPPPPQMVPPAPRPMATSGGGGLRIGSATATTAALKPVGESEPEAVAPARSSSALAGLVQGGARAVLRGADHDNDDEDKWKWWYYVLGGVGIIAYQGWLFYENGFYTKYLSGIFGGICCIGVGIWDFKRKRAEKN